jgi:hypothetical protein
MGSVTVLFRNKSSQPVYLPSNCTALSYEIAPQGGPDGVGYVYEGACLQTCEDLQKEGPSACGACPEQVYRIEPGKTLQTTWNGTGLKGNIAMPASCWWHGQGGMFGGTCAEIVAAAAGTYVVKTTGFSDCTGPCTCDANGVCQGSPSGQQASSHESSFSFPNDTTVEVDFDVCAFGCPAGSP